MSWVLLVKLTTLSRPPCWTWRPLPDGEGKKRIRKGEVEKKKREYTEGEERGLAPKRVGWVCP